MRMPAIALVAAFALALMCAVTLAAVLATPNGITDGTADMGAPMFAIGIGAALGVSVILCIYAFVAW